MTEEETYRFLESRLNLQLATIDESATLISSLCRSNITMTKRDSLLSLLKRQKSPEYSYGIRKSLCCRYTINNKTDRICSMKRYRLILLKNRLSFIFKQMSVKLFKILFHRRFHSRFQTTEPIYQQCSNHSKTFPS